MTSSRQALILRGVVVARAAASGAAANTPGALLAQVDRLLLHIPADASDTWLAVFLARVEAAGVTITAAEIESAKVYAAMLEGEIARRSAPAPATPPPPPIEPPPPPPAPGPPPPPLQPTSAKHRWLQPQLFQSAATAYLPTSAPYGPFAQDLAGPTDVWVSFGSGWAWRDVGGDVLPGAAAVRTDAPEGTAYEIDVTDQYKAAQVSGRWFAWRLSCSAGRDIAGRTSTQPPVLVVNYADGDAAAVACSCLSPAAATGEPSTCAPVVSMPAFIEFGPRNQRAVSSAKLRFVTAKQWWSGGADPTVRAELLDPPTAAGVAPRMGLAALCDPLDDGLIAQPGMIGVHRYLDGERLEDFAEAGQCNINSDWQYCPSLWGEGAKDLTKLPHRNNGKWINLSPKARLVPSTYAGEGFAPLAPGLGALRIEMPQMAFNSSNLVGNAGQTAEHAIICLPDAVFGRAQRLFIRSYWLLAPFTYTAAQVYPQQQSPGAYRYDYGGKCFLGPDHSTSHGGFSMTSGGPYGWQMRGQFAHNHVPGPEFGGLSHGLHLGDYMANNPAEHQYGQTEYRPQHLAGSMGLGMMYTGHWYCREVEIYLNTVPAAGGFVADGALRMWIDGLPAYDRTGMVFRVGPVYREPASNQPQLQRAVRDLGVRNVILNWHWGGRTLAPFTQVQFMTGLAWGTEYIGPMKGIQNA